MKSRKFWWFKSTSGVRFHEAALLFSRGLFPFVICTQMRCFLREISIFWPWSSIFILFYFFNWDVGLWCGRRRVGWRRRDERRRVRRGLWGGTTHFVCMKVFYSTFLQCTSADQSINGTACVCVRACACVHPRLRAWVSACVIFTENLLFSRSPSVSRSLSLSQLCRVGVGVNNKPDGRFRCKNQLEFSPVDIFIKRKLRIFFFDSKYYHWSYLWLICCFF